MMMMKLIIVIIIIIIVNYSQLRYLVVELLAFYDIVVQYYFAFESKLLYFVSQYMFNKHINNEVRAYSVQ